MTDKLPDGQPCPAAPIPGLACLCLFAAVALAGCSSMRVPPMPEPLRPPGAGGGDGPRMDLPGESGKERTAPTVTPVPGIPVGPRIAEGTVDRLGADLAGDPIAVAFNNAPLPEFIDELFNELLGLSYHIAPTLQDKTDLVTLRVSEPMTPAQVFATARRILEESYGVRIREEDDGTLTFVAAEEITTGGIPLLINGRTRPEVPATQRVIFQIVVMKAVRPVEMVSLLNPLLRGS